MSTSAISSQNSSSLQALLKQSKQDLQSLQTDLGSSNLAGAQTDFAAFQQDATNLFQSSNGQQLAQLAGQPATSQSSTDLQTLQAALSSGNVTGAQKALASFQQDLQTQMQGRRAHGHHRHHQDSNSDQSANAASLNGTGAAATSANGVPNSALTLASMLSAYKAFNTSGAAMTGSALSVLG
jgi:hypothetical protein